MEIGNIMDKAGLTELAIATIKVNDFMSRIESSVYDIFVFTQTWGSTALGFGGIGGAAMTTSWTHVVLTSDGRYHIFFDGKYAYSVENPTEEFKHDLEIRFMKSVEESSKVY